MSNISNLENKMVKIITEDKKVWVEFYLLMKQIEDKELFKESNYRSFTAWIKDFALRNKIHESILWNRLKAGRVYEAYEKQMQEKGTQVMPIQQTKVSMDSLVLVDKIAKRSPQLGAELTQKAINGEITKKDLSNTYKILKSRLDSKKEAYKNNLNLVKEERCNYVTSEIEKDITVDEVVTVSKIITAFKSVAWLGTEVKEKSRKAFKTKEQQDKYQHFQEFAVYTGTTKQSRRIDVVIAENLTTEKHFDLKLHGIEIKISKSDLLNDCKYTEYAEFVDFLWLCVTPDLEEEAINNSPNSVGIIIFDEDSLKIKRQAALLNPLMKQQALITLALKLL